MTEAKNARKKPDSIKELELLARNASRQKHPTLPEGARYIRPYNDRTANGLTRAIIDYLRFKGWQAERINCTGRYVDQSRVVRDVLNRQMRIGSGKWIPGSMQRGTADISATIRGRAVKIEVKMKDRQSDAQKQYQEAVERAGGMYWLCHSFDEFISFYNDIGAKAGIPEMVPTFSPG